MYYKICYLLFALNVLLFRKIGGTPSYGPQKIAMRKGKLYTKRLLKHKSPKELNALRDSSVLI